MSDPRYNARTEYQKAAVCHCRPCQKDMFFSYEDNPNINIVSVYITPENVNKYGVHFVTEYKMVRFIYLNGKL
jgi:hypothetical protein